MAIVKLRFTIESTRLSPPAKINILAAPLGAWTRRARPGGVLDEGVYRISNFYIGGAYSSYGSFYLRANGTSVNLSTEYHADMRYDLFSYWKLEHFGSNVYLIRSMVNPNLVLNYGANGVELYDISTGQTPTSIYFQLSAGTTKTIKPILDVNKCLTASPLTPTQSSPYYYSSVSIATADSMPFENWIFAEADIAGIYFRDSEENTLCSSFGGVAYLDDTSVDASDYGYACYAYNTAISGQPTITWRSSNSSIATVNAVGAVTMLKTFSEDAFVQDDRRILVDTTSGVCYLEIVSNGYPYYINIT